ncbi:MAG TPA: hypothetical protein VGR13_09295 [Actinomycetota bacterium]|nr:hypothetical protein [Actinomycetota bacterium]
MTEDFSGQPEAAARQDPPQFHAHDPGSSEDGQRDGQVDLAGGWASNCRLEADIQRWRVREEPRIDESSTNSIRCRVCPFSGKPIDLQPGIPCSGLYPHLDEAVLQLIENSVGLAAAANVTTSIHHVDGLDVSRVPVEPSGHPVVAEVTVADTQGQFAKKPVFYMRLNNKTRAIEDEKERERYIAQRWGRG